MDILLETKKRLEDRIAYIKNVVWGSSPFIEMLAFIRFEFWNYHRYSESFEVKFIPPPEQHRELCEWLLKVQFLHDPEIKELYEKYWLTGAEIKQDPCSPKKEEDIQKRIDEQKNCNAYIEEMVQKEMQLRDINMEIWRENRNN